MILAAALLVLAALGLFAGGVVTGATGLYWACVALSAVAAVLLVVARRRLGRDAAARPAATAPEPSPAGPAAPADGEQDPPARHRSSADRVEERRVEERRVEERRVEEHGLTPEGDARPGDGVAAGSGGGPAGTVAGATTSGVAEQRSGRTGEPPAGNEDADPPVEEVEVTDLLLIVDLRDEVLVVDEHPRYHLPGCPWLTGRETVPLPLDEARVDGFTPCGRCSPDRNLAAVERARRAEGRAT